MPIAREGLLIGRGAACDVALDDPLVSRRHARVALRDEGAVVEDLGSANGVFVNGARVEGARRLATGDVIVIGGTELEIVVATQAAIRGGATLRHLVVTADAHPSATEEEELPFSEQTRKGDALLLIGQVAEKMLLSGQVAPAEQMLAVRLQALLIDAKASKRLEPETADAAARYAVKLAQATGKADWVNYVFELYRVLGRALPAAVVDELFGLLRRLPPIRIALLREYIAVLGNASLGAADRFVLQRLNGLEKVAATR